MKHIYLFLSTIIILFYGCSQTGPRGGEGGIEPFGIIVAPMSSSVSEESDGPDVLWKKAPAAAEKLWGELTPEQRTELAKLVIYALPWENEIENPHLFTKRSPWQTEMDALHTYYNFALYP